MIMMREITSTPLRKREVGVHRRLVRSHRKGHCAQRAVIHRKWFDEPACNVSDQSVRNLNLASIHPPTKSNEGDHDQTG